MKSWTYCGDLKLWDGWVERVRSAKRSLRNAPNGARDRVGCGQARMDKPRAKNQTIEQTNKKKAAAPLLGVDTATLRLTTLAGQYGRQTELELVDGRMARHVCNMLGGGKVGERRPQPPMCGSSRPAPSAGDDVRRAPPYIAEYQHLTLTAASCQRPTLSSTVSRQCSTTGSRCSTPSDSEF